jgi:ATP-binding cassette subfamily B (MDR/TAP) protein 1
LGLKVGNSIVLISMVLSAIGVGIYSSWKLTLASIAICPIILFIGWLQSEKMDNLLYEKNKKDEEAGGIAEEVIYNIKTVASFSNYKFEIDRYNEKLKKAFDFSIQNKKKVSLFLGLLYFFVYLGFCICIGYALYLVKNKDVNFFSGKVIKPGDVNIVMFAIFMATLGLTEGFINFKCVNYSCISAYDFFQLRSTLPSKDKNDQNNTDNNSSIDNTKKINLEKFEIIFENVDFSYPNNPKINVLNKINFKLKENCLNAIVGSSGSGKSTIISLIQKFYEIKSGKITIGDHDISKIDINQLRSLIGYIPQEPMLFNKTIRENILIGRENISENQIQKACNMAQVSEFLKDLENGLDTIVGVKGSKLSGGQKQRVAIARAILCSPKILIMDEATSALDVQSEKEVQKAIDGISDEITTIVIAHRLSTIKNADQIIVLENGKIKEIGNHESLLKKNECYADLVYNQIELNKSQSLNKTNNSRSLMKSFYNENNEEDNEEEIDDETLKKNKNLLLEIAMKKKKLIIFSILSSVSLGVCFPIKGLLAGSYMNMLSTTKNSEILREGWVFIIYFFIFAIVSSISFYYQR